MLDAYAEGCEIDRAAACAAAGFDQAEQAQQAAFQPISIE